MERMDKVIIENIQTSGIIGIHEQERKRKQALLVSVTLFTDTRRAAETDLIEDCIDYDDTSQEIRTLVEKSRRYTLEALAEDIANLCLSRPNVQYVRVRVEKPRIIPKVGSVGIEILRKGNEIKSQN